MKIALICGKCGKIHTDDDEGYSLIIDFRQKQISFICQNKNCKYDNIFCFEDWQKKSNSSPLPKMRML
jgi:hypothetical protein